MSINQGGKKIDLRVATSPTMEGEKVVTGILENSNTTLGLDDLGFSAENNIWFTKNFTKPYGTMRHWPDRFRQVNVITVEDPVEYVLPGINQVQTNGKAGLTFAHV